MNEREELTMLACGLVIGPVSGAALMSLFAL
jgi:hypothetical protein